MLFSLNLNNFKNHKNINLEFSNQNIIYWSNWSWKTNILEAIYLLTNTYSFLNKNIIELVNKSEWSMMISWNIKEENNLKNVKITYDSELKKMNFILNNTSIYKIKYLSLIKTTSIFFSPFEINIMYLWPNFRRDFFDEILNLTFLNFWKIKIDYGKILKNRNKVLKNIYEKKSNINELSFWNKAFIDISIKYYEYRIKFIDFIENNLNFLENILDNKYCLSFNYETKINLNKIYDSILNYLEKNTDRDIIIWHTCVWPHLDDFCFNVKFNNNLYKTNSYLSLWENKSLLIWLKFLQILFLQIYNKNDIILLLDDIFSELDDNHISLIMQKCINYQTFISTQNVPKFLDLEAKINKLKLI